MLEDSKPLAAGLGGCDSQRTLYRQLRRQLEAAGCFDAAPVTHVLHMTLIVAGYATAYGLLLTQPQPWLRFAALLLLAFVSVQAGYIAHEAGHGAITRNRRLAIAIGQFFNTFLTALCYSHFQKIHVCHHNHCNERERDVDLQSGLFSLYPQALRQKHAWPGRFVSRHQSWMIWLLVSLQGLSLKIDSLITLARDPRRTRVDQLLLATHLLLWFGPPVAVLGIGDALINYGLMTWFIGPYLGTIFLVNHIGMHVVEPGEDSPRFTRRLQSTRNLGDSRVANIFFGGLNNHIEHHLFPMISSARLPAARPIVRDFCRQHGLSYCETSWFDAARRVSRYLRQISRQAA